MTPHHKITKQWLAVILVIALVPWLATAQAATTIALDESDQAELDTELLEAAGLGDRLASKCSFTKGLM